jgi:shikimate kinase
VNVPAGHLVLVGMMGAGKTTVGRILAERLGRPLVDTDQRIEASTGRTVRQIFADEGEPAFRALETQVLRESLAEAEPSVIAAAGGVVLDPENRRLLVESDARVVWLCADTALLVERVRNGAHRPLLDDDPAAVLERMAETRSDLYREVADVIITVDGRPAHDVADAVLR